MDKERLEKMKELGMLPKERKKLSNYAEITKKDKISNIKVTVRAIILATAVLLAAPFIYLGVGWLLGVILQFTIGGYVVEGFNLLTGTSRFTIDNLPMTCSILAFIGSLFSGSRSTTKKKD